ncbi:LOW QUALITY PROTEIN: gastrin [Rhinoderma darwinii]|uniref:LOW QUALITY PROTEIN: gastrin n=1 Tax=Rhinoderma darwinii TaxID=43563 RepID=UPI003F665046
MAMDGRRHPALPSIKRCSEPAESQRDLLHHRPLRDTITTEMDRKVCVSILLAMLATAALCRPMTELQSARYGPQKNLFPSEVNKRDLLASLSHEQKQRIMSQLVPQLLAEISNAEGHLHPMHDRDYAGWMDFGRRSSEDQVPDS